MTAYYIYYTYDPVGCVFETTHMLRKIADPKKLKYTQLADACWTDFEEARESVGGVLRAKIEHLQQIMDDTSDELIRLDHTYVCHDCDEILPDEDVYEYRIGRTAVYLCECCFKQRGEH